MSNTVYDVLIIGGGPGGIAAAVYALRGGLSVAVADSGGSALLRAETIQNYYGVPQIGGEALYKSGKEQARALGAEMLDTQVTFLSERDGVFVAETPSGKVTARRIVLAVGASTSRPNIAGLTELEGRGVSYCAVCDGFFYRKKRVAVIGAGEYARHELEALKNLAASVALLTNGEKASFGAENTYTQKITSIIERDGRCGGVAFADGSELPLDGVFVAVGIMGGAGLAKSLGLITDKRGFIKTDDRGMTNISGIYAAGDCAPGIKQISRAVAEGMRAGLSIIEDIRGGGNA